MAISENVLEFYDQNAPNSLMVRGDSSYLQYLDWGNVKRVLDIGCGGGFDCKVLGERHLDLIVGVDEQASMIEYAELHHGAPLIEYVQADIEKYDLGENCFDAVVSNWALLHIRDKKSLFERIKNALRYGGTFLFQDVTHYGDERPWLSYETTHSYHKLLREAGFSNLTYFGERPNTFGTFQVVFKVNK